MTTPTPHASKTWLAWVVAFAFLFFANIVLPLVAGLATGGGQ